MTETKLMQTKLTPASFSLLNLQSPPNSPGLSSLLISQAVDVMPGRRTELLGVRAPLPLSNCGILKNITSPLSASLLLHFLNQNDNDLPSG